MKNILRCGLLVLSCRAQFSSTLSSVISQNVAVLSGTDAQSSIASINTALLQLVQLNSIQSNFLTSERETCEEQIELALDREFDITTLFQTYADMLFHYAFAYTNLASFTDLHAGIQSCLEATQYGSSAGLVKLELDSAILAVRPNYQNLDLDWTAATTIENKAPVLPLGFDETRTFCSSLRLGFFEQVYDHTVLKARQNAIQPFISEDVQLENIAAVLGREWQTMQEFYDHHKTEMKKFWFGDDLPLTVDPYGYQAMYEKRLELYTAEGFTSPQNYILAQVMEEFDTISKSYINDLLCYPGVRTVYAGGEKTLASFSAVALLVAMYGLM